MKFGAKGKGANLVLQNMICIVIFVDASSDFSLQNNGLLSNALSILLCSCVLEYCSQIFSNLLFMKLVLLCAKNSLPMSENE